ncbi:MAG: Ltp family lipoprotein [Clostridia bacterium]|nr:Ltp family lipoprotein [Clostridia bacterium]
MFKRSIIILLAAVMLTSSVACSKKTATEAPADTGTVPTAPAKQEPKFKIPEDAVLTDTQREAAESAQQHLEVGVSKAKLTQALLDEGYSQEDIVYAVDIFNIDWMEMARGTAEFYTYYMPFSYQGIIDHLIYMEFTPEEAQYGADQLEIDWNSMAKKYIEKYFSYHTYTDKELEEELVKAGFTKEQAQQGIKEYNDAMAEDSKLREELGLD